MTCHSVERLLGELISCNQKIAGHQCVHLRALETIDGFFGPTDDRFVVVEGSVEHDGNTRGLFERFDEPPIAWSGLLRDGLQTPGTVDMRRSANLRTLFRAYRVCEGHERRRMRFLKPIADCLRQNRRRKGPKNLPVLDASVENLLHIRTARISHDAAISQRSRAPLSAPLKPTQNFPIGNDRRSAMAELLFG